MDFIAVFGIISIETSWSNTIVTDAVTSTIS